jgi:hypothetical protein
MKRRRPAEQDCCTAACGHSKGSINSLSFVRPFSAGDSAADMVDYYRRHQVLLIKKNAASQAFSIDSLRTLFRADPSVINKTFCLETKSSVDENIRSGNLFGADPSPQDSWYASFIAQGSKSEAVIDFLNNLPFREVPSLTHVGMDHSEPIWVFVGRNSEHSTRLRGRLEHTDSVSHDGSWHFQAKGKKLWYIRPADSPEWNTPLLISPQTSRDLLGEAFDDKLNRLCVVVDEGDIFMINTRLWWHQTRIPYTGKRGFSISYARDFYCDLFRINKCKSDAADQIRKEEDAYTNVDSIYASRRVKRGEIVLTEQEMPDCALPRSDKPNCEIVWLENGQGALVARKNINTGDWLTIAPSDDESVEESEDETF